MEEKRIRIKYHRGYDAIRSERLTAVAKALGGDFSDRPLEDEAREMSFQFDRGEDLKRFFTILKALPTETEQDEGHGAEDANYEEVEQCERAIKELLPLVDRCRNEKRERRILIDAVVRLEDRMVKLGLVSTLRNAQVLRQQEPVRAPSNGASTRYGFDFRIFFNQKVMTDEDFQVGLNDGDTMAELLSPMLGASLIEFNLSSAPPGLRLGLEQTAERLVFLGVHTHCICFRGPYRFRHDDITSLKSLYDNWHVKSLTSTLRGYNESNQGLPKLVFDAVFNNEIEPVQKQLGLGWWRRTKNRTKFESLFSSAILLGMLYDMKAKERSDVGGVERRFQALPKRSTGPQHDGLRDLSTLAMGRRKRILVSHEEALNEAVDRILCSAGYEVKTTAHPAEVLGLVGVFLPEVALIKLVAPEINGLELSAQLATRFPNVKIVLVGPFCDLEWTERFLQTNGINCRFLNAPFSQQELLEIVKS